MSEVPRHEQEPAKDITQELLERGYRVEAVYGPDQEVEFSKHVKRLQDEGADFKYHEKWGQTTSPQQKERMTIYLKPKEEKSGS